MNMEFIKKLTIPKEVKEQYPLSSASAAAKAKRDAEIKAVFERKSSKFLLITGPCSADNEDSVLDYVTRLRRLQEKVADKLLIIPRVYTSKPRSQSTGYMGMLHQPDPCGNTDVFNGVIATRCLHIRVIEATGFGCADEMLYPENYRYLSDLLSYVAVGARSVEDQQHRLTAGGLDVPVGMKNPTSGDLSVLINSISAAQKPHRFIYRGWEVQTSGNRYSHAVLRGYTDRDGRPLPNYSYEDLMKMSELYSASGLKNPAVIVDTNHANSGKHYLEQIKIAEDVLCSRRRNDELTRLVCGLMIESYIEDGSQETDGHIYGKSITDPCLGWDKTERLILEIADKL